MNSLNQSTDTFCFILATSVTEFQQPSFLKKVSLAHKYEKKLNHELKPSRVSNYLLLSGQDAITPWHTDFTFTSVAYFPIVGSKEFFVVPATKLSRKLFEDFRKTSKSSVSLNYLFNSFDAFSVQPLFCLQRQFFWISQKTTGKGEAYQCAARSMFDHAWGNAPLCANNRNFNCVWH